MIKLNKEQVEAIYANAAHQSDALVALYQLVYPDWENIASVDGFPRTNRRTNEYLCGLAIAFDRKHHPNVFAGGLWLNNGFGTVEGNHLPDWVVEPCAVTLKQRDLVAV